MFLEKFQILLCEKRHVGVIIFCELDMLIRARATKVLKFPCTSTLSL